MKDTFLKLVLPNVVKVGINFVQSGFNIAFRSIVHLLRATLITRVLSAITIFIIDLHGFIHGKISRTQLFVNITLSFILVIAGTIGWNIGLGWFGIEIIGGILGAAFFGTIVSWLMSKFIQIFIKTDNQKMMEIVNKVLEDYPSISKEDVTEKCTPKLLKEMFKSEDKMAYVKLNIIGELIC